MSVRQMPEGAMSRRRGQAYGADLRDRVLAAAQDTIRAVAARFQVSPSYVSKVRARLRETGLAAPGPQHNHVRPRLEPYYDVLRARVAEQTDATIAELRAWMKQEHGVSVSHPVMWETLGRLGLTLKKSASVRPSRTVRTSPPRALPGLTCSPGSTVRG
jgi:transposase